MATTITILSPLDIKPGAQEPSGKTVQSVRQYYDARHAAYAVEATFEDGSVQVFLWPTAKGWVVDGQVGQ